MFKKWYSKSMKKLVLKVSLITVAAILVLLGIVYGCFSLFAPHLLGSLFERVGANNASLYFYEKEYNKNQNTSNLYRVLNKAIIFEKKCVNIPIFQEQLNSRSPRDKKKDGHSNKCRPVNK